MKTQLTAAFAATLLVACGSVDPEPTTSDQATCSGGKCDSTGFEVIPGGIWTACHIEPGQTVDLLRCQLFGEGEPLAPDIVTMHARNNGIGVASGLARAEGDDMPARLRHDDYPVEVEISVGFGEHKIEGFSLTRHVVKVSVDTADALPEDAPLIIDQPFDIWPVQIATTAPVYSFDAQHEVAEGVTLRPSIIGTPDELQVLLVAGPSDGSPLSGELRIGPNLDVVQTTLPGPGRYVAAPGGLRAATDADVHLFDDAPEPTEPIEDPTPEPCTFDYLDWLGGFGSLIGTPEAQAHLDGLECKPVGEAEYAAWHTLFVATLDAGLPGPSSTLDDDEIADVETVLAARPDSAASDSYTLFLTNFDARLTQYMPQPSSPIDEDEGAVLDLVSRSRPQAVVSDESYAAWFAIYDRAYRSFAPQAGSPLDAEEVAKLDRIAAVRPTAEGESAYAGWFELYAEYFDMFVPQSSSPLDSEESARLDVLRLVQPESTSVPAYEQWLQKFTERFTQAGATISDDDQTYLEALGAPRPCVVDTAAAQAALDVYVPRILENADLYLEMTTVSACEMASE